MSFISLFKINASRPIAVCTNHQFNFHHHFIYCILFSSFHNIRAPNVNRYLLRCRLEFERFGYRQHNVAFNVLWPEPKGCSASCGTQNKNNRIVMPFINFIQLLLFNQIKSEQSSHIVVNAFPLTFSSCFFFNFIFFFI